MTFCIMSDSRYPHSVKPLIVAEYGHKTGIISVNVREISENYGKIRSHSQTVRTDAAVDSSTPEAATRFAVPYMLAKI